MLMLEPNLSEERKTAHYNIIDYFVTSGDGGGGPTQRVMALTRNLKYKIVKHTTREDQNTCNHYTDQLFLF